jgi:hypothetical protein
MSRRLLTGALTAALAATTGFAFATPAFAATNGSSYSTAAKSTPGTGIAPVTTTTGLLSFLSPVISGVVNPLTAALTALPSTLLTDVAAGLTGSGLQATNPGIAQTAPSAGTYPASCASGGWNSSDCYGPTIPTVSAAPLLALTSGATQGFATGDSTGYTARAKIADPNLTVLGLNIGDLGLVEASSFCSTSACTSTQALSNLSLLGGAVQAKIASGNLFQVSVAGGAYVTVSGLSTKSGTGGGLPYTVSANGNLLKVQIGLSLTQLLTGLGLGNLLSTVSGLADAGSTASLTLVIGPGTAPVTGSTQTWGLEVGVDLSASISLSLLGLAGVTIAVPTGISGANYGDLLDLKLAYTNAYSGALLATTVWIPSGQI